MDRDSSKLGTPAVFSVGSRADSEPAGRDATNLNLPGIELPRGGGAIGGLGEKISANPATGAGSVTVPIALSPGRSGFGPSLSLSYASSTGNGPFGLGWTLSLSSIRRKTSRGLPKYDETDIFVFAGMEDLVEIPGEETDRGKYTVRRYRPRVEGSFTRIEAWTWGA